MQNKTKVQNITKGAHSQTITHETRAGQSSRDIRYPTIPPAKTRTYHCASDRQTDRLKTKRQLRQNITQEAIMTYLEMLKPGYQKKLGNVESCNYATLKSESLPLL